MRWSVAAGAFECGRGGQAEGLLERRLLVDPAGFYQFLAEAARYAAQGCTDVLFDVEGMSVGVFHLGQHVQSQYGSGRRKLNTLIRQTDRKNPSEMLDLLLFYQSTVKMRLLKGDRYSIPVSISPAASPAQETDAQHPAGRELWA